MEKQTVIIIIDSIKKFIFQHESMSNPHYKIGPNIVLKNQMGSIFDIIKGGIHNIKYEVEYISKLDNKWRKLYSKEIDIDIDKALADYRDLRLDEILKESDS